MNNVASFLQSLARQRDPARQGSFLQNLGIADLVDGAPAAPAGSQAPARREPAPAAPPSLAPPTRGQPDAGGDRTSMAGGRGDARSGYPASAPAHAQPPLPGARQMALEQGTGRRETPPFRMPNANELADTWAEVTAMTAEDPSAAKRWAAPLQNLQTLALTQHHQQFKGDPMASPADAARYARHMGAITGRFGNPLSAKEAADWGDYVRASDSKALGAAKQALAEGNLAQLNQHIGALMGPGWRATGVQQGSYELGGVAVPAHVLTLTGPDDATKQINSVEFELAQADLETRLRLAEAQAKAAEAKAGEPTRKLKIENEGIQAEILNRQLKQQRDNPQAATAGPEKLGDLDKLAAEAYYKRLGEIDKMDPTMASPEVKQRLREALGREMAPALGRVMPWLAGQDGPSPELRALLGDTPGAAAPGAPGQVAPGQTPVPSAPAAGTPTPSMGLVEQAQAERAAGQRQGQQSAARFIANQTQAGAYQRAVTVAQTAMQRNDPGLAQDAMAQLDQIADFLDPASRANALRMTRILMAIRDDAATGPSVPGAQTPQAQARPPG